MADRMFTTEGDPVNVGRPPSPLGRNGHGGPPPDGLEAATPVLRRLRGRVDRQVRLLDRLRADPFAVEPPGLPELIDTARQMRHDTESLLLLAGEDTGPRAGGVRQLSAVLDEAVDATEEPLRVDVRRGPSATIGPGAAIELLHVVAEVVDHVTAVHPAGRVEVSYRPEARGGIVVDVSADGATRHDPGERRGRRGIAAAERMAQRSRSGILLRVPTPTGGALSHGPIASVHCPGEVVTIDEPGYGSTGNGGLTGNGGFDGRPVGRAPDGLGPAYGDSPPTGVWRRSGPPPSGSAAHDSDVADLTTPDRDTPDRDNPRTSAFRAPAAPRPTAEPGRTAERPDADGADGTARDDRADMVLNGRNLPDLRLPDIPVLGVPAAGVLPTRDDPATHDPDTHDPDTHDHATGDPTTDDAATGAPDLTRPSPSPSIDTGRSFGDAPFGGPALRSRAPGDPQPGDAPMPSAPGPAPAAGLPPARGPVSAPGPASTQGPPSTRGPGPQATTDRPFPPRSTARPGPTPSVLPGEPSGRAASGPPDGPFRFPARDRDAYRLSSDPDSDGGPRHPGHRAPGTGELPGHPAPGDPALDGPTLGNPAPHGSAPHGPVPADSGPGRTSPGDVRPGGPGRGTDGLGRSASSATWPDGTRADGSGDTDLDASGAARPGAGPIGSGPGATGSATSGPGAGSGASGGPGWGDDALLGGAPTASPWLTGTGFGDPSPSDPAFGDGGARDRGRTPDPLSDPIPQPEGRRSGHRAEDRVPDVSDPLLGDVAGAPAAASDVPPSTEPRHGPARRRSAWDSYPGSAAERTSIPFPVGTPPPWPGPPRNGSVRGEHVDELFGPLIDLPADLSSPWSTPIFEAVASAWFRDDPEPVPGGAPADWESPSDGEWRAAAERASLPDATALTPQGLPRRRPGGRLVPPRAAEPDPGDQADRVPDRIRERLSGYQRGLQQGRHRAEPGDPGDPTAW